MWRMMAFTGSALGKLRPSPYETAGGIVYRLLLTVATVRTAFSRCGLHSQPTSPDELGSAWELEQELQAEIRGRDLVTGLPKTIVTSTHEIREAIEEPVSSIVDAVKVTLDKTPPELAADVMERGIVLAGGGALLKGLPTRLAQETGMPIRIAPRPLEAVALGSGMALEEFPALEQAGLFSSLRD